MLAAIGVGSVPELFDRQIPAGVRLGRALALPDGMGEQDVYAHLRELAARNVSAEEEISFLGAGMYDHYVPALIDMLMERSEFLTPYTPYQPEISQGGLQVMFEYQTAICELTGLPVSNASVYEGPSAVAAAGYLAKLHNGRSRLVVSAGMHPHSIQTLRTLAHGYGMSVVEVPLADGVTDVEAWTESIDARHERGDVRAAQLLRRGRGRGTAERRGEGDGHEEGRRRRCGCRRRSRRRGRGARGRRPDRSDHARHPEAPRGVRRGRGRRRGPVAGQPVGLTAVPHSGCSPRASPTCAGCPAGSRGRPSTWTDGAGSC